MEQPNAAQAEQWSAEAATWVQFDQVLDAVSGTPGRLAMQRLDARPGMRILDIGCGTGVTTLELAAQVGPDGSVDGVDIARDMLAAARAGTADGPANLRFHELDAQTDDLGEREYDGAYSRFGVMFFADPGAAFTNVRRALRPGGVLSFVCWQEVLRNDWIITPVIAAAAVTGTFPEPPEEGAPGPFSLAEPGQVRALLDKAGFTDIEVEPHTDDVVLTEEQADAFGRMAMSLGPLRATLEALDEATRTRTIDAVVADLRQRAVDGEIRLSRAVNLVTARA